MTWVRGVDVVVVLPRRRHSPGSEFRIAGGGDFGDRLFQKLSATNPPLIRERSMLSHSYNPPSQPTAAAFVERMNQTIRSKLRMAVQAEQGDIRRSNARDAL